MLNIDYSFLPVPMQQSIRLYVERGIEPGGFLTAVLENNFVRAFARADDGNLEAMHAWAMFLYNYAPAKCWGSPEKVDAWIDVGGYEGYTRKWQNENQKENEDA